ncbi:MAG: alkaline phosphatase D family protein [Methylothermaceae bacterium]|nr:alkaline phosphatase D family protein [Methylothermaceae bacterium]
MTIHTRLLAIATIAAFGVVGTATVQAIPPFPDQSVPSKSLPVTHGVAAGDVTSESAVIWSRTDQAGFMHVRLRGPGGSIRTIPVSAENDFTGQIRFEGLRPATPYAYDVWFSRERRAPFLPRMAAEGGFRTAPSKNAPAPVTFVWGGDVGGQNVCRDVMLGIPLFKTVDELAPDFFVGLGDMIYADGVCEPTGLYGNTQIPGDFGPSAALEDYWAHWKYNRADEGFQQLLSHTPYVGIWDDHEVVNDFGPLNDSRDIPPYTPGEHLMPKGLQAFKNYTPIGEDPLTPNRLYRNIRWGKHLELLVLDNRQYRDHNGQPDSDEFPKTMLGREQLTWLQHRLKETDATWKVIASSVPLSIPTGFPPENGRDGWANFDQETGYERELLGLIRFIRDNDIRNVVFITTDVHFAEVFRYQPFSESPGFQFYEFVSGPLNAGLFPNREFDRSLGAERLFFFGPESSADVSNYEDALGWMNFGMIAVDADGLLHAGIRNLDGETVYRIDLNPR